MELSDAEVAVAAAQAGAEVIRARYGTRLARFDKGAGDFATDADIESERAILGVLRAQRPADAVLGEELGLSGSATAGRTWLVDPLCGTLNFAAQTPLVAVNVTLRSAGRLTAACSAHPVAAELLWTDGHGAYLRRDGADSPLRPSAESALVDVNVDEPRTNADRFLAARLLTDPDFMAAFGPRVLSTSLPLSWVAAGRRAAYVSDGHQRDSVHFAAGIALCEASGCVVTGLRGEPLGEGTGGLVAAADGATHARLIEIIGRQFSPA